MQQEIVDKVLLKQYLNSEILARDCISELSEDKPDPLMVAKRYNDETISLICALFAYGNAKLIVKFLNSLDFNLLDCSEDEIRISLKSHYYRFQKPKDVVAIFLTLKRLKEIDSIENIVYDGYKNDNNLLDGISNLISKMQLVNAATSQGYDFLIGKIPSKNPSSAYKRYMMYFRWMVRKDSLDMGLWNKIDKKDLLLPLDVHTFNISKQLGLLQRKSYDYKAVIEATQSLRLFDANDPIKYDFALYRIGQEGKLDIMLENLRINNTL
jgi:uncharacterized protein (TIGR02757 family)